MVGAEEMELGRVQADQISMEIDLSQPPPQVKTLEEGQALINVLWSMLREQEKRIEVLEEKLNTNSSNSSKPPSPDQGKRKSSKPHAASGRKAGGQPGHVGRARELLPEEEVGCTHHCHPEPRCACGGAVKTNRLSWRHQVIELPDIEPVVTEYRLYAGVCGRCGGIHEAALPAGVSPCLAGARLLSLIGTLSGTYRLSKRLVQGLLQDVFQIDLSVGAIQPERGTAQRRAGTLRTASA